MSHIPVRISFKVTSKAESRMALDQPGAEALAIPGEIIFKYQNEYLKCWCVHAENNNIKQVLSTHSYKTNDIDELGKMATYCFRGLKNASNKNETESVSKDFEDDLLYDAGALICDTQKASITMLQRKLGIGFNRAARIMDRLEELDVVGKEEALKPRDILMTAEEWKDFYDSMVRKKNGL